jgi:hypothetical protein
MIERRPSEDSMVAMQLITDEGVFICNAETSDITKISDGESGVFIVIHCAIRLDAMVQGQYEIYRTKLIEASSIDFYQFFQKEKAHGAPKQKRAADAGKGKDG